MTNPSRVVEDCQSYVTGNIFKNKKLRKAGLCRGVASNPPEFCFGSTKERKVNSIDYVANLLRAENDESTNQSLVDLPADDRLEETRRIMHKDLHRH